jgi:hypothetical protein
MQKKIVNFGKSQLCCMKCIQLAIWIFGFKPVVRSSLPWQFIVITSIWHSVVANTNNFLVFVHNTGSYLDIQPMSGLKIMTWAYLKLQ